MKHRESALRRISRFQMERIELRVDLRSAKDGWKDRAKDFAQRGPWIGVPHSRISEQGGIKRNFVERESVNSVDRIGEVIGDDVEDGRLIGVGETEPGTGRCVGVSAEGVRAIEAGLVAGTPQGRLVPTRSPSVA